MARAFEPSSLYSLLFLPHQWSPVQPHPGTISSNNILPSIWEGLDCGSQVLTAYLKFGRSLGSIPSSAQK